MVTLCLDFGNTRLKYAVFENDNMQEVQVLDNDGQELIRDLIDRYHPDKSILVFRHRP